MSYRKDELLKPRKIKGPEDYRPGTTKGKIDAHDIWVVEIEDRAGRHFLQEKVG